MLTWNDVTVKQFQDVYKLSLSKDQTDLDEKVISIMYGISSNAVGEMSLPEFNKAARECNFILKMKDIPGKPVKYINIGRKKYFINYRPDQLKQRQYTEILYYSDKTIENLHLIMASLVQPVRFGIKFKNNVELHQQIASEMLNAKITDVYQTCLFFCKLYSSSIKVIQPYLEKAMMDQGITQKQAQMLSANLINITDGYFQPNKQQNLKELL